MSTHTSPFTKRFRDKMDEIPALCRRLTLKDASAIQRAFVAALKEEVLERYARGITPTSPHCALRIAGLGSFKMKTRPQRTFHGGINEVSTGTVKPPARRLAFSSKWEEIK